jgi:hypothetical protein
MAVRQLSLWMMRLPWQQLLLQPLLQRLTVKV